MAILLFSLRGVPADEADEIRDILTHHNIDYYETDAGNWGVSMPAFWLKNDEQLLEAEDLLNDYHQQRAITQRQIYQQLKAEGKQTHFFRRLIEKPAQFFVYTMALVFMVYISIKMVFEFGI